MPPTDESEAPESLRDTIEAAMSEPPADSPEPTPAAEPVEAARETPEPASAESAPMDGQPRGADGKFQKKPASSVPPGNGASASPGKPGGVPAAGAPGAPAAAPTPAPQQADPYARAPQTWKPAAREEWAKLPPSIRQEVYRRERETAQVLQQRSESYKFHQQFNEAVRPYEAHIRAEGAEPLAAVKNLLQTAMALRTAPPPLRAQKVAEIIRTYGVDPGMVGQYLQGGGVPQQGPQGGYDPRVDQLMSELQQAKAQREQEIRAQRQALAQRAEKEVMAFAQTHEFYNDVSADMADLMEVAARRGVDLDMETAYSRAVAARPDIYEIVQRKAAAKKAATAGPAATPQQRAAVKSVRTNPVAGGPPKQTAGRSLREDILESMEEAGG